MRPGSKRVLASALVASALITAVALAAVKGSYKGKTSQHQPISLKIANGFVRKLDYRIVDRCRGGKNQVRHDFGFSPLRMRHGRFGGTFLDKPHHARAIIHGTFKRGIVRGSLSDRTRNSVTHHSCSGTAHFRLRHA